MLAQVDRVFLDRPTSRAFRVSFLFEEGYSLFRTLLTCKIPLPLTVLSQVLIMSLASVHADDYISPQLVKVTTPSYEADFTQFKPRLGTYTYVVSWQGIPAASATVTFSLANGEFVVDAAARTNSAIDLLYKLRYQATGTLRSHDLSPINLLIDHRENSSIKNVEVTFPPGTGRVSAVRTRVGSTERKEVSFVPHNPTLDPIGAGFLARSLQWNVGDTKTFDVFNGKSRYLISLSAVDKRVIEFQGDQRECFVISPRVRNLTTTKAVEKLREAFIYVTADDFRDVLKIESSVFIGTVLTQLESFEPALSATPLQVAQSEDNSEPRARAEMR